MFHSTQVRTVNSVCVCGSNKKTKGSLISFVSRDDHRINIMIIKQCFNEKMIIIKTCVVLDVVVAACATVVNVKLISKVLL